MSGESSLGTGPNTTDPRGSGGASTNPPEPGGPRAWAGEGLDLEEEIVFQETTWKVERVGWIVLSVVLVAALVGLLGDGPLSRHRIERESIVVETPWIARASSEQTIVVELDAKGRTTTLWLGRALLDEMSIVRVVPAPIEQVLAPDRLLLRLPTMPGRLRVRLDLRTHGPSLLGFDLGVGEQAGVRIRQVILP